MVGFILLHRELLEWEWYQSPNVFRVYIHLLLKANFVSKKWEGIVIERGQLVTSFDHLSKELKLSVQQIRSALSKLQKGSYILKSSTNSYTLITLVNYDKIQSAVYNNNNLITNHQQKTNKPPTITKKRNNLINKTIEIRREEFKKQVFECPLYPFEILNNFFKYWSESNINKEKMRFENENFFEVEKRLDKWMSNEKNSNYNVKSKSKLILNR